VPPAHRHEGIPCGAYSHLAVWPAVAALTLLGLALRLAAARGALWLDEAWSAHFAVAANGPLGVILRINHDNNHLLNTLWLQIVGPAASPLAERGLSIACGTAMIPLAALFAGRRGAAAALVAAFAFALSPIMVTYGAEARGYAPMMAATLMALLIADRWLESPKPYAWLWLSLAAFVGILAQFLMAASLAAIIGWMFVERCRTKDPVPALRETFLAVIGPVLVVGIILGFVAIAAFASPTGFEIGNYEPFKMADWRAALNTALGWTFGIGRPSIALLIAAILAITMVLFERRHDARVFFYALALIGYPLAFVVMRIGNAGMPRYYLLAAVALLLLFAERLAEGLRRPGAGRVCAAVLLALFTAGSLRLDAIISINLRADPARAIAALHRQAPGGTTVAVVNGRMAPVLRFAARDAHYPLHIVEGECRHAPFLLADGNANSINPAQMRYCGTLYRQIARARSRGLSGTWWWLFERVG
jgi:hypothetical protein